MKASRLILPVLACTFVAATALASSNENAKLGGHLVAHAAKGTCLLSPAPPCNPGESSLAVDGNLLTAYDVYILVLDGDPQVGIAGAAFGIKYDSVPGSGIDAFGWNLCADLDFPGGGGVAWPDSGSGNLITFDPSQNCQSTAAPGDSSGDVTAIFGSLYVYAYSPDELEFTARTYVSLPDLKVADCSAAITDFLVPDNIGSVGFGLAGTDPCAQAVAAMAGGGSPSPDGVWSVSDGEFALDLLELKRRVLSAPERFSPAFQTAAPARVSLPTPEGGYVDAKVWKSSILSPELQAENPGVRTFVVDGGNGISGRIGWTRSGFMGVLHSPDGTYTIDASRKSGSLRYVAKRFTGFRGVNCQTPDNDEPTPGVFAASSGIPDNFPYGDSLYVYRIVISADDEYITFFDSDTTKAKDQIVKTMMEVNSIYEREAAIRLQLIKMIVFSVGQSPFTGVGSIEDRRIANQAVADSAIGSGNYELGHLFSQGPDFGNAGGNNVVCTAENASAVSRAPNPGSTLMGLGFAPHEMCHQLHGTGLASEAGNMGEWSYFSCIGVERGPEPGNGTTIMSYAGVPGSTPECDSQPTNDPYFNSWNLFRLANGNALHSSGCAYEIEYTGNTPPAFLDTLPHYTIPRSTAFQLTAPGVVDPDTASFLSFCWEQQDHNGPGSGTPDWPSGGPMFRSRPPSQSVSRMFPKFSFLVTNEVNPFELLPWLDREMSFRLTVRDNQPGCGGVVAFDVGVSVLGSPFKVLFPNGGEIVSPSGTDTVRWQPGDSLLVVDAPEVDILFFDWGHQDFDTLSASTANDGVEVVTWPGHVTYGGRVLIRPRNQIYFDISDSTFAIIDSNLVAVSPQIEQPPMATLSVFPNPMAAGSNVLLSIPATHGEAPEIVRVWVSDMRGRRVSVVFEGPLRPGEHQFSWSGKAGSTEVGLPAGVYFVIARVGNQRPFSRKVTLM